MLNASGDERAGHIGGGGELRHLQEQGDRQPAAAHDLASEARTRAALPMGVCMWRFAVATLVIAIMFPVLLSARLLGHRKIRTIQATLSDRHEVLEYDAEHGSGADTRGRFGVPSEYHSQPFFLVRRRGNEIAPMLRSSSSFGDAVGYYFTLGFLSEGGPPRIIPMSRNNPCALGRSLLVRPLRFSEELGIVTGDVSDGRYVFDRVSWRPAFEVNEEFERGLLLVPPREECEEIDSELRRFMDLD